MGILFEVGDETRQQEFIDEQQVGNRGLENSISRDELNTTDISAAFGAGYQLANSFNFTLRYNMELTDVELADLFEQTPLINKYKNQVAQLSVGYRF